MTAIEWHAGLLQRAALFLAHAVEKTPPDKLNWRPCPEGDDPNTRTPLHQLAECATVNRRFAALFRGETVEGPLQFEAYKSADQGRSDLKASANELAAAIKDAGDGVFDKKYKTSFGEMPGSVLMEISLSNMHYHSGQICQNQLMYGDTVFHIPPEFMS
jgi:hypothetical protein